MDDPAAQTVSRPLKILCVASFLNVAGAPEAILRLGRQLRHRGHTVENWFLYKKGEVPLDPRFDRVLRDTPRPSPLQYAGLFLKLVADIRREKPDVVVAFLPLANVMALTAARLAGVRVTVASQRSPGDTYGRIMRILDRLLGSIGVFSRVVCVSEAVEQSFSTYPKAYRDRLCVVHNGIEWTPSTLTREAARARFNLPADGLVAASAGRLSAQKNYPLLLEALAQAPGVVAVIAGDGELRDALASQARDLGIADRVRFLGAIARADIPDLLRAADVFVQTSLFEGQSNALLEAMNEGMPTLVADIPEQRETLTDTRTGETVGDLAPIGQPDAWASILVGLRDDPARRAALAAAAKALVDRQFTVDRMIAGFEAAMTARPAAASTPSPSSQPVEALDP